MHFKVCTCWDDGVLNDERLVGLLRKHGAKATFNLNPGLMSETRGVREWAAPRTPGWSHLGFRCGKLSLRDIPEVYAGFQLASHCWRHENAGSIPDDEWIDFSRELLHNRPFPEVIRKLSAILPKIFKGASGVLYMYSNNQDELHQIFSFGEHKISDPTINRAECASFDSAKIVVADYSDPQHVSGCMHLHYRPQGYSLCAPVEGLEEHFGILTIQVDELPQGETIESWKTKMSMVVTAFGLFVANQNLQIRFKTQSLRDQLTGLVNKRYLEEALTRALSEARRHGTPIGMIMLTMDNLEYLKNTHGVHAEEQMLWELAQRLPRYIRTEDIPCRYGENTLCVLLPGADKVRTQQRAEKIRHEIENLQVAYGKLILQTTLSLGVATYPENAKTAAELTSIAEQAMQQASALGKNRVCTAQASVSSEN